jgi:hypothetical protein
MVVERPSFRYAVFYLLDRRFTDIRSGRPCMFIHVCTRERSLTVANIQVVARHLVTQVVLLDTDEHIQENDRTSARIHLARRLSPAERL